jgi:hypothetical protein
VHETVNVQLPYFEPDTLSSPLRARRSQAEALHLLAASQRRMDPSDCLAVLDRLRAPQQRALLRSDCGTAGVSARQTGTWEQRRARRKWLPLRESEIDSPDCSSRTLRSNASKTEKSCAETVLHALFAAAEADA